MAAQPGAFDQDGAVDVLDRDSPVRQLGHHRPQQLDRVGVPIAGIGIREALADVPQTRRPQEGVHDRVSENVRVGMPRQAQLARDLDPAQDEPPARLQPVGVPAQADHPIGSRCPTIRPWKSRPRAITRSAPDAGREPRTPTAA